MEDVVNSPEAMQDALLALFDHSDHTLRKRVEEMDIRRLYQLHLSKDVYSSSYEEWELVDYIIGLFLVIHAHIGSLQYSAPGKDKEGTLVKLPLPTDWNTLDRPIPERTMVEALHDKLNKDIQRLSHPESECILVSQDVVFVEDSVRHLLSCNTETDYAGDLDNRRSTSRYVFTMARGAVSWRSRLQTCVTQSTTEAEYVATSEACKEAIWLGRLVKDLGIKEEIPMLHCDSQSAIQLARNPVYHSKTKHVDVKYHFIREMVEDKQVQLVKVHTTDNPTELLGYKSQYGWTPRLWADGIKRYCVKVEDRRGDMRDMVPVIYSGDRYFDDHGFMYIVMLNPSIVDEWRMTGTKEKVDIEPEEAPPALNKPNLKLQRVNDMTKVNTDNIFLGLYKYDGGEHMTYYRCEEPLLRELFNEKKLYVFTYGEVVKTELIMTDKYGRSYVNVDPRAQLAREKIKEALSRKAEGPILEPSQGSPKRPRWKDEEELEHIQIDLLPSSPMAVPPAPPSSPITPFPPTSTPRTPPSPRTLDPPRSPPAPTSPQQQQQSAKTAEVPSSSQLQDKQKDQPKDKANQEMKKADTAKPRIA
ncbi:hypothetical protein L7F22_064611 [Adiantum nelumboides]|nr:hypothetical protein [Adiantum nelumboides]